jgi:acyl-coenzyme A thioesterase PaaI-like protein
MDARYCRAGGHRVNRQANVSEFPDDHFVRQMGVRVQPAGEGSVEGHVELRPAMWASGTQRPRLGILATFVDVVAGYVPDGPRTPTIDLRVQTLGRVPSEGMIRLLARPLNVGRSIIVSETTLEDETGRVFARASATFKNRPIPGIGFEHSPPPVPSLVASFEELLGAREIGSGELELDPAERLGNGFVGTVQGGVQALLGECAAARIASADSEAVDLDIRYLGRLETGPLRARAQSIGRSGSLETFGVSLVDAGAGDRLVSQISMVWHAAP